MLVTHAECLQNVPFHLILNHVYGLIFNHASPTQEAVLVKILLIDRFYSHVFEIFVSEK